MNRAICIACIVYACLSISLVSTHLRDQLTLYKLDTHLTRWQSRGFIEDIDDGRHQVETLLEGLDTKRHVDPSLQFRATQAYEWLAFDSRLTRARSKQYRRLAHDAAYRLLRSRPASAVAWSSYLGNELVRVGYTDHAKFALERALFYGGWELESQRTLAILGINYWPSIDPKGRQWVREVVRRGLLSDSTHHPRRLDRDLIDLAHQRQWHRHIKPLLVNDDQRSYYRSIASR